MTDRVGIGLRWLEHGRGLEPPKQQTAGAAGVDIAAALGIGEELLIQPGGRALVPSGFCIALPEGVEAQIRPRSGLAAKYGVTVLNAPGTIDADYRGELKVILINHGSEAFAVHRGDRVAQLVVARVAVPDFSIEEVLDETERGARGHGSTGHKAGA